MIGKYRKLLVSCVVFSVGVFVAISQPAVARDLACCNANYECVNGTGSPQYCYWSCPMEYQAICSDLVGPCGPNVKCQWDPCTCMTDIPRGCCLADGGHVVTHCSICVSDSDPLVAAPTDRVDHSLPEDQWMEEGATAPTSGTSWWVFAIPLFLILPAVPVLIRRRRNS